MSVNEKTLCLSFEVRMPQGSGLLNLAFPAVVANTILRRLTSDWGRLRRHAPETQERLQATVRKIRFGGCLQLPSVRIAARDLNGIQPGSILRLNLSAARSAEWCVAGQSMAHAQPIRHGAHRAARLENISWGKTV